MSKKIYLIWYKPELVEQARELRNNCTKAEAVLWQRLKGKQMRAYDFHRQKPLLYYIVDFYCTSLRLAIELDGEIHYKEENQLRDRIRQEQLQEYGISFLRFTNAEVLLNCDSVVKAIEEWIDDFLR